MRKLDSAASRGVRILAVLGLLIAALGLSLDLLPGASPGMSAPQLTLIASGIMLALVSFALRTPGTRAAAIGALRQHLAAGALITLASLIALEFLLALAGLPTYFPTHVPAKFLDPVPWWTCDEAGCHYVYEEMLAACERDDLSGLRCAVNRQGFRDTQDFVVGDDFEQRLRILVLGDSFAFGGSADLGKSFVETVEASFSEAVLWNTGIPGAGTNQALMSFNFYAPLLQPQLTLLAFYMNDFDDNMMPVDSYFMGVDSTLYPLSIRQYHVDLRGNVSERKRQSDLWYRYHGVDSPHNELHRIAGNTRLGSLALRTIDAIQQMLSKTDGARHSQQVEATRRRLQALRDAADGYSQLLVLLIPRREDLAAPGRRYQSARQLLDELGIAHIDPRGSLDSALHYANPPDVHWSNAGHKMIAEILIECLERFELSGNAADCAS